MSNMYASRKGPLLAVGALFGGILYMTYGAKQQPRPRATHDAGTQVPVSETLQAIGGQGGARARDAEQRESLAQYDPKDTRIHSADPSAQSKRNPQKVRGDLGGDDTTPGGGGQGKHIGDRGKDSGDLPWKKIGPHSDNAA